jgi:hypothetical protein
MAATSKSVRVKEPFSIILYEKFSEFINKKKHPLFKKRDLHYTEMVRLQDNVRYT